MAKGNPKWHRRVRRALIDAGCRVEHGRSGHIKVYRDDELITTYGFSASDPRAFKNFQKTLRQRGVDVEIPNP